MRTIVLLLLMVIIFIGGNVTDFEVDMNDLALLVCFVGISILEEIKSMKKK